MIKQGIGKSKKENPFEAGIESAKKALKNAGISQADFVFVYANPGYLDYESLLQGVRKATNNAPLIGCMAGGLITQEGGDEEEKTAIVMVLKSDKIKFTPVMVKGLKKDSTAVGREIGEALAKDWPEKAKLLLTLPAGLSVNPDAFFRGLEAALPEKIPFVGGTSGGPADFKETCQFFNDQVLTDAAPCVLMSGDFNFEIGVSHGAVPSKISYIVTKAKGNIIHEFDHKPAFNIYKDFMGSEIKELNVLTQAAVCLSTKVSEELKDEYEDIVLRIPLDVLDDGSLVMAAEWPEGTEVFIAERRHERIVMQAGEIARKIRSKIDEAGKEPEFVLNFNCLGRAKQIMGGETAEKEIKASQNALTNKAPWLGWYTFGEIAPIGKKNEFHNWSGVLLAVY